MLSLLPGVLMQIKILSFLAIVGFVVCPSLVGCSGARFHREELALLETAKRAYRCEARAPSVNKYSRHFERGWKQAYYNVAKGMGTCPPSTPPEAYWSHKYKSPDGCRKIAAWYEGYRLGALAAQGDCQNLFADVPVVGSCQREDACLCCPEEVIRSEEVSPHVSLTDSRADDANAIELNAEAESGESEATAETAEKIDPNESSADITLPPGSIQLSSYEHIERLPQVESE